MAEKPASCPRRARPRLRCCPGPAGAGAWRSAWCCRAGAARSRARRGCVQQRTSDAEPICAARRMRWASVSRRWRRPVHRQVAHPHVVEELQALEDLAQHEARDLALGVGYVERLEPLDRPARRHVGGLVDAESTHLHRRGSRRRRLQSGHGTTDMYSSIFSPGRVLRVRLLVAPLEVGHDPLEGGGVRTGGARSGSCRRCRGGHRPCRRGSSAAPPPAGPPRGCPGPPRSAPRSPRSSGRSSSTRSWTTVDRALRQGQRRVRHHKVGVDLHLRAETGALRARAVGRVEREHARARALGMDVPQCRQAKRSEKVRTSAVPPSASSTSTSMMPSASATAVSIESASRLRVGTHHEPVDHHGDVVLVLLVGSRSAPRAGAPLRPPSRVCSPARSLVEELAVLACGPAPPARAP